MTGRNSIQLIGAGGHSKVVIDAVIQSGYEHVLIFDDACTNENDKEARIRPLHTIDTILPSIISIGSNHARAHITRRFPHLNWINAIHPSAIINPTAKIGKGVYIGANVIIQPYAVIGDHTIINTGSIIEHDVEIGAYCHISPGNILTGAVKVGNYGFLGAGTTVIPNIVIGENVIIGAGSIVINDIPSSVKAVGCPCKVISTVI